MKKLIFAALVGLSLGACTAQNSATPLDTKGYIDLEKTDNVVVIDVRTPAEVAEAYIPGTDLFFDINSANFKENIASLDKSKTYIVYCRSGKRSSSALSYMTTEGFTNLYELSGGILAWEDASSLLHK